MANGAELEGFPRPAVAVDLAILTVVDAAGSDPSLRVLVHKRSKKPTGPVLPGGFIRERATIQETVADVLERKIDIDPGRELHPRLLRVFDDPTRDNRTWAISLAHSVSMHESELGEVAGELVALSPEGWLSGDVSLLFDHDQIVSAAVDSLRERYEIRFRPEYARPDPDGFLAEPFTLHQLRKVHEAVLGEELHKDNFAHRMKPYVKPLMRGGKPVLSENLRGRPATLYRRAAAVSSLPQT